MEFLFGRRTMGEVGQLGDKRAGGGEFVIEKDFGR